MTANARSEASGGPKMLVYGFGNPGRADDGLGPATADAVARLHIPGVATDSNYQLNAEDALTISRCDIVVFVDATENDVRGARLSRLSPSPEVAFTTHAMPPGSVLALCEQIYDRHPAAYVLEIKGYEWDLREGLSDRGRRGMEQAVGLLSDLLRTGTRAAFDTAAGVEPHPLRQ